MSMTGEGVPGDCAGEGWIATSCGGSPERCPGCKSCVENGEMLAAAPSSPLRGDLEVAGLVGSAMAQAAKALDIAIRLGRAEKEIEQLKEANAWLLKQLNAKEPWVSVNRDSAKEQAALARPALELDWSVHAHDVIQRMFHPGNVPYHPTVADLVSIPPVEWLKVPRCGMLVLREMDKMFKELGVEWPGEWPRR
jgi:hypothetical protein